VATIDISKDINATCSSFKNIVAALSQLEERVETSVDGEQCIRERFINDTIVDMIAKNQDPHENNAIAFGNYLKFMVSGLAAKFHFCIANPSWHPVLLGRK
jgi:hypothetical protein